MSPMRFLTVSILLSLLLCIPFVQTGALPSHKILKASYFTSSSSSPFIPPLIEIYEVKHEVAVENVESDIEMEKEDSSSMLQMVNVSRNSDLLFGEETESDSALLFHCHASYPIQWVFRGDSDPEFNTNTSTKIDESGKNSYSAYLLLGARRKLDERETGKYICTSVRNKKLNSYIYLFVTKSALFTTKGLETIYYSSKDDSIRIPCSLSEPRAIATLQKSENGVLKCPMNDSVRFDAKKGFTLDPQKLEEPQGTYLCIADYNNTFQIIKYNVMKDDGFTSSEQTSEEIDETSSVPNDTMVTQSPTPPVTQEPQPPPISDPASNGACANKTCGENAACHINKQGDVVCRCQEGYLGNPYVGCKHKSEFSTSTPTTSQTVDDEFPSPPSSTTSHPGASNEYSCESYDDCPNDRACIQNSCEDPCLVDSICGPNTHCETMYHTPFCKCKEGYEGDPYSSQEGQQCQKSYCDPNPCGPNTLCKYVNGIISCSCKPGYITHSDGTCHPNKKNSSTPDPLIQQVSIKPKPQQLISGNRTSTLPPGKECHYDIDCPDDKMCIQDKCENPCVNACGAGAVCHTRNHFPRCLCPEGTTGDPFYKCVPLFSELLGSSTSSTPTDSTNSNHSVDADGDINCGGKNSPCGPNTICQASRSHFVCVCPNNFVGDPYSPQGCSRKYGYLKCEIDSDCPHFMACLRHQGCVNPCNVKNVCQDGRSCIPYSHRPACLKTDNFNQIPRDDLVSENKTADAMYNDKTDEMEEIPDVLKDSNCLLKIDGKVFSLCGRNSICYDESSLYARGLRGDGIFCGCMENYVGDPYVACESPRSCESTNSSSCEDNETCQDGICREQTIQTNSSKLAETNLTITASRNPCSPSPCANAEDICIIVRANHTFKCVTPTEKVIASSHSAIDLQRSDACQSTRSCNQVQYDEDSDTVTTEVPVSATYISSSVEEGIREPEKQPHETINYSSNETMPSVVSDEETVVDF